MRVYRGCMFMVFGCFVATLSVMFGLAIGPLGLVLPTFLILTAYLVLDNLLIELMYFVTWLDQDHN